MAQAEGVSPKPFDGFDGAAFMPGTSEADARQSLANLAAFNTMTAKSHSGLYRDLAVRKRRTEVDAQVGVVVEVAARHGIAVPLLARLAALIHDIEDGHREMSEATFHALTKVAP